MRILLLNLAICWTFVLPAQIDFNLSTLTIPNSLKKDASSVVRMEKVEFRIISPGETEISHQRVVTLLSSESRENNLVIQYDKSSRVQRIEAALYDAMGRSVRKIKDSEVNDYSAVSDFSIYEDNRLKHLEIQHGTLPYTVDFSYTRKNKGPLVMFYPSWDIQSFKASVQHATFVVRVPANMQIHFKPLNIDIQPVITRDAKETVYTWTVENLPAIVRESYGPSADEILPKVLTAPASFEIDGYAGSMSTWKDYGAFLNQLWTGRDQLSPGMAAQVKAMAGSATSNVEKINRLYRYLQQNTRYVSVQLGIGGWQPFEAQFVEKNKYGDCKALTNFMKSMLKEAGIAAYPAVIHSGADRYEVPEDFVDPSFNHVILHIPSENYWLECTSNTIPPNYIGEDNADRPVLLITEAGGRLAKTPALSAQSNRQESRADIHLAMDGSAKVENRIRFTGANHELFRALSRQVSAQEYKEYYLKNGPLPACQVELFEGGASDESPEASLHYLVNIMRYGSKGGKRLFVPLNTITPSRIVLPVPENRRRDIVDRDQYVELDTTVFHLPAGATVESIPKEGFHLDTDFGKYDVQIIPGEAGTLQYIRRLEIRPFKLPAERYQDVRQFYLDVGKMDGAKMVLVIDRA